MLETEFFAPMRVYIEDTDAGGVVYYVNYLKFMERARTEFLRMLGFPKAAMLTDSVLLLIRSANVEYLRSALLDDALEVSVNVLKLRKSYFEVSQDVRRITDSGEYELLAQGKVKIVCVNREKMKPMALPNALYQVLQSYTGAPAL